VKFKAIAQWALNYSIVDLCSALPVSTSAYYRWRRKPVKVISERELLLYREAKRLFNQTRSGLGYVKLCRALNKSGFTIKWTMPIHNWNLTLSQLAIFFEGRLDSALDL